MSEERDTRLLVAYHGGCPDGLCAAWLISLAHDEGSVEFLPCRHGEAPDIERYRGRRVLMVDFSYPAEQLVPLVEAASSFTLWDHHAGARDAAAAADFAGAAVVFDTERSGAGIARDELAQAFRDRNAYTWGEVRRVADLVEDHDIWRHQHPESRDFHAAMTMIEPTVEAWDAALVWGTAGTRLIEQGRAINRFRARQVEAAVRGARPVNLGDEATAMAANAPHSIGSDVGEALNRAGHAVGAYYFDTLNDAGTPIRQWGIRSRPDGPDVSVIARRFGGNGHTHAAGFRTVVDWFGKDQETDDE